MKQQYVTMSEGTKMGLILRGMTSEDRYHALCQYTNQLFPSLPPISRLEDKLEALPHLCLKLFGVTFMPWR